MIASISSFDILKIAVATGFLNVMFAQIFSYFAAKRAERNKSDRAATYLALRLAVTLESFAYECQSRLTSNDNADHPDDDEFPQWCLLVPKLDSYPDDIDGWRSLDGCLASQVLDLRNKIIASQNLIDLTIEYIPDQMKLEADKQIAARGLEAWRLARTLRYRFLLETADPVWNFTGVLEQKIKAPE